MVLFETIRIIPFLYMWKQLHNIIKLFRLTLHVVNGKKKNQTSYRPLSDFWCLDEVLGFFFKYKKVNALNKRKELVSKRN